MEFKESLLKKEYDISKTEDLANYINTMIDEINKIDDDILKEVTINKISEEAKIDADIIRKKIIDNKKIKMVNSSIDKKINKKDKYIKSEENLIYYMLQDSSVIKMYEKKITHMPTDKYRYLATQIDYFYKKNGYINVADLITYLEDEESKSALSEILKLDLPDTINYDIIDDYLDNIREYNEKKQTLKYKEKLKNELNYESS